MHVLILPTWYPSEPHGPGGVVFRNYVKMYQSVGIESRICLIDYRLKFKPGSSPPISTSLEDDVEVVRFCGFALPKKIALFNDYWILMGQKALMSYIDQYGRPDLIHAHSFFSLFLAHRIFLTQQIPFAYTEHSTSILLNKISNWKWARIRKAQLDSCLNTAVSQDLAQAIHIKTGNLPLVLPNPINTTLFKPGKPKEPVDKFILSCGSKIHHKGLDVLLQALTLIQKNQLQNFKLYLTDQLKQPRIIRKYIQKYHLVDLIELVGFIPQKDLSLHMQNCMFYVSSSRFETFGMPLFEALSCGKPVVSTKTSGVASFIPESCGLWCEPGSVKGLANKIEEMSHTYSGYLAEKQREMVVPTMSFENLGKKYVSLLEKLL